METITVSRAGRLARFAVGTGAVFGLSVLGWLMFLAVVPGFVLGWEKVVVTSGSMRPAIRPGDVVVAAPARDGEVPRGTVVVFHDPGRPGLVTHRVVRTNPDGGYVTRGDANAVEDSTPVRPAEVVGSARILVPGVGRLWIWTWQRRWTALAGLGVAVGLALWAARFALRPEYAPWPSGRATPPRRGARPRGRRWRGGALALAVLAATLGGPAGPVSAAFTRTTANGASSFSAAWCTAPGTQTLTAVADTYVDQSNPAGNFGNQTPLIVKANSGANVRTLVQFTLPSAPGCTVTTASLELNTSTSKTPLTYLAYRAASAWSEMGVTWDTQPGVTGTPASAPTVATNSWLSFDVTQLVRDAYAGTDHGFLIRDQVEDTGTSNQNKYVSREGTVGKQPRLVVTLG